MAVTWRATRPGADEHAPYYKGYIEESGSGDLIAILEQQLSGTALFLDGVPAGKADHRYAPGKWSVKEVIGHLADSERVFAYRALRFARQDESPLASFDENAWVPAGRFDERSLADLAAEFAAVRRATIALLRSFDDEAAMRRGTASGKTMSVRALAAVIAGHERHHVGVLKERYGLG